jgi:hypothetical protein
MWIKSPLLVALSVILVDMKDAEMIKYIEICDWGTYPEKCVCCGMGLMEQKTYTKEYKWVEHRGIKCSRNKTNILIKKKRYCSRDCQTQYLKNPDEFGLWWKE